MLQAHWYSSLSHPAHQFTDRHYAKLREPGERRIRLHSAGDHRCSQGTASAMGSAQARTEGLLHDWIFPCSCTAERVLQR